MKRLYLVWLIAKRELIDQMRDWRILMPMVILTLFFPYLMTVAAQATINYINQFGASIIAERMLPFLILVVGFFPVTVSLIVALEAFVGEKERGTLEPLLSSPVEDWHLYMGKLVAGVIVPLAASYIGIAIYMTGLQVSNIPLPQFGFVLQTIVLTAIQTVLMVSAAIVVSTQSTSVRAANLLASFIVIPVALLIQGESALMFWGDNDVLWFAVIGVGILSALLIRLGLVHFQRESLIGREIDVLNLAWVWKYFSAAYAGSSQPSALGQRLVAVFRPSLAPQTLPLARAAWQDLQSLGDWYKTQVGGALKRMLPAILLTLFLGAVAVFAAYFYTDSQLVFTPASHETKLDLTEKLRSLMLGDEEVDLSPSWIFTRNVRAEAFILGFGFFSFGVLGVLLYLFNFAFIGLAMVFARFLDISPWLLFAAGVLPHGIIELPSVLLVSASVLYMGARLVTPISGRTIGEVVLETLADVFKVYLGVSIPLLFFAAIIEAWVTPQILYSVLGFAFNW